MVHHELFLCVLHEAIGALEYWNLLIDNVLVKVRVEQGLQCEHGITHGTLEDHPERKIKKCTSFKMLCSITSIGITPFFSFHHNQRTSVVAICHGLGVSFILMVLTDVFSSQSSQLMVNISGWNYEIMNLVMWFICVHFSLMLRFPD